MAKAQTKEPSVLELAFKEREQKLLELVNAAITATGVGLKPQMVYSKDGAVPVIASVDQLAKKEDVKTGQQSAPVRPTEV